MQTAFHQERVAAIADQYKQRGYQVMEEPDKSLLPDFLQKFQPDILAQNGIESVIVEVQSYGQVARSRKMERLAKSVEDHPGWRLELILSNPPQTPIAESARPTIGFAEIEDRIANSKYLAAHGDLRGAVMLLWSALEAVIRTGLERIPASFINNTPTAIIKQGVAYGLMDPKDYDVLNQLLPIRNAAVHGFDEFVDTDLLDNCTRITVSILAEVQELK